MTEIEELTKQVKRLTEALGSNRGGGGGFGSSPSGGSTPFFGSSSVSGADSFANALNNATQGVTKFADGSARAGDALHLLTDKLSKYGGAFGKILGNATDLIGDAMIRTNDNLNKAGEYGATMHNSLAEFDYLIKGARMSQEEYTAMVQKGAQELNSLGSTVNRSQKNYLQMNEMLHGDSGVVAQLEKMGWQANEVNKALYVTAKNRIGVDATDNDYKKRQIEATEQLMLSIDENTRITGIGHKEQLESIERMKLDSRIEAKRKQLTPEQNANLDALFAKAQVLGPGAKELLLEEATGGIRYKEGREAAASLGSGAAPWLAAIDASLKAKTPEESAKAKQMTEDAVAKIVEAQNRPGMIKAATIGGPGVLGKISEEAAGTAINAPLTAKMKEAEAAGNPITYQEALRQMRQESKGELYGVDPSGKKYADEDASIKVATTLNEADRTLKGAASGLSKAFGELTTGTGKLLEHIDGLDDILKNRSQKDWEKLGSDIVDKLKITVPVEFRDKYLEQKQKLESNELNDPKRLTEPVEPHIFASGTPDFENFLSGNGGFKDMFTHFDPKGEPALLHGNEIVANEDQMKRFMHKMFPSDMFKQISDQVHAATSSVIPSSINSGPISLPLPTNFGNDIANQLKPTQFHKTNIGNVDDIDKVFAQTTEQLKDVTKKLSEVADKLKNINFTPDSEKFAEKFSEKMAEVFKNIDPTNIPIKKDTTNASKAEQTADAKKEKDAAAAKEKEKKEDLNKPIIEFKPKLESSETKAPAAEPPAPPVETAKVKTATNAASANTDPEAGLKDPRDEFTNAEMKELETGRLSDETIKRNDRESENKFFIDKIAELKGRNDEDAVHDLPIFEAQYAAFKPKYDAETAAAARQRELTLAAEKKQREQEATIKSKDENTVTYDPINGVTTISAPPLTPEEENERLYGRARVKTSKDNPENHDKYFQGWDDTIREEKNRSREFDHPAPNYSLTEPYDQDRIEPALSDGFTSIGDKLSATVSTNVIKPEDNTDRLTSAMETLKSPDYSAAFSNLDNKLVAPEMNEESRKQAAEEARQKAMNDKMMADLESRPPPPELEIPHTEAPPPTVTPETHGPGLWDKLTNIFSSDNRPLASRGNVKYEYVEPESPEENAAKLAAANTPEEIAKRKADPNDPANIYREHVKNSGMYKHDDLWKSIVGEDKTKKEPAKPKEPDQSKPAPHHIGGLETWKEFNARLDAEEVKKSHAQIKDVGASQPVPSTHELTNKPTPPTPEPVTAPAANDSRASEPAPQAHQVSLKEIYEAVLQLNKTMGQMASHTESMSSSSIKQIKEIRKTSQYR